MNSRRSQQEDEASWHHDRAGFVVASTRVGGKMLHVICLHLRAEKPLADVDGRIRCVEKHGGVSLAAELTNYWRCSARSEALYQRESARPRSLRGIWELQSRAIRRRFPVS